MLFIGHLEDTKNAEPEFTDHPVMVRQSSKLKLRRDGSDSDLFRKKKKNFKKLGL